MDNREELKGLRRLLMYLGVMAVLIALYVPVIAASETYSQAPVILKSKDVLPEGLLKGKNYQVEDEVKNDGLINSYQLTTDYGPVQVESTAELMIRITELNALTLMEEMDRMGVFGDAVVAGVKAPVEGAVELVKSPIETGKEIVEGTGKFLSNVGRSIVSDDPDEDNVLKVALGYDVAKRNFAYEFGINPYTAYEPVVERLGEIARAAVAGGLAPRAAMAAIKSDVVTVMRISGTARSMMKLVRDNSPGELRRINKKKLEDMALDDSLIEAFLDNYSYNPQEETLLVGELGSMEGVKGRDVFIGKADLAMVKSVALFNRLAAQMMAAYLARVAPAEQIRNIGGILHLKRKDGGIVLLAPVDYVFWTKRLADKMASFENAIKGDANESKRELWITGKIDGTARAQFESQGWKITENANDLLLKDQMGE